MLLFLPYRNFSIQKSAMEHLHSPIEEEKSNPLQLSRTLVRSLRYREPLLLGLVTAVFKMN